MAERDPRPTDVLHEDELVEHVPANGDDATFPGTAPHPPEGADPDGRGRSDDEFPGPAEQPPGA